MAAFLKKKSFTNAKAKEIWLYVYIRKHSKKHFL